jgi:hypothetical protein
MYGSTTGAGSGQAIFTDDVSLQVFMEHLKRLVSGFFFRAFFFGSLRFFFFTGCWRSDELGRFLFRFGRVGICYRFLNIFLLFFFFVGARSERWLFPSSFLRGGSCYTAQKYDPTG